jgi:hypothetical protein
MLDNVYHEQPQGAGAPDATGWRKNSVSITLSDEVSVAAFAAPRFDAE